MVLPLVGHTYGALQEIEQQGLQRLAERFDPHRRARLAHHAADPVAFARERLGHVVWARQEELLRSVRDNRRTVSPAGHGVSKSFAAAELVCWWMETHDEAVAVTVTPTGRQARALIWAHIKDIAAVAGLSGEVLETAHWKFPRKTKYAQGISPKRATKEDIRGMLGYHSSNLLIILEEAPGLPRLVWDAVDKLIVAENNRLLAIGNPISTSGPFWEACTSVNWNTVHISCLEFPNVVEGKEVIPGGTSRVWVDEQVRDNTEPCAPPDDPSSPVVLDENGVALAFEWPPGSGMWHKPNADFCAGVLGIAPGEAEGQLIPMAHVVAAQSWIATPAPNESARIGLDPCRYGSDPAVMCVRRGGQVYPFESRQPRGPNPSDELGSWLYDVWRRFGGTAYVDVIGYGAGTVDKARELGVPVVAVDFSKKARDSKQFANVRMECHWAVKLALATYSLSLPQDEMLTGDLTALHYHYTRGKKILDPKEVIRERLRRSTDKGDALALTYAGDEGERPPLPVDAATPEADPGSRWQVGGQRPPVSLVRGGRWRR